MIKSNITILGCNSSLPTNNYYPTSQILYMRENYFLIDCGEGTQVQLIKSKIKINKINNIFISHLHGDHYYGIMGILATYQLLGRKNPLNIYTPNGLNKIIYENFKWSKSNITYKLNFIILNSKKFKKIFDNDTVKIYIIPLKHKIYTNGFLFKEKKRLKNLNINNVKKIKEIKISDYLNIKKGKDFIKKNGQIIPNSYLTFKPKKPLSYAFCTDTSYSPEITKYLNKVDLLYHESTYLHNFNNTAKFRGHSTTIQAANIAKLSNVKKLLLGHYSCRYRNIKELEKEAQKIFPNTEASKNLKTYYI
ncbi:ribonuclease Z [Candidatus Shikimatogenerans bostrichidophilus]|uniref:ribonuclease Z n=1 Tax=Candidatus Shikimatogenerans bostrichidophilus TaxID=2943807 RepID=UPI0029667052